MVIAVSVFIEQVAWLYD